MDNSFDDRINPRGEIRDLKYPLIKNYLQNVNSSLLNEIENLDTYHLARDLRIADGPAECFKPLNVGLLFFNDHPENFFPYCQIEVVNIPEPTGQGMEERVFKGPLDEQLQNALNYIRNNVIAEKIFKIPSQAESVRIKNYSYEAIEEFLSNAIYHKSYQIHEPVTVRIEADKIEITSIPGPDRSITDEDIRKYQMRTRRYRNRRIGDFLKELHLVEGRNTGIPTAIKAIKNNGSPLPTLLTDEDRSFFSVIIPIHEAFKAKEPNYKRQEYQEIKTASKRRTKEELKEIVLDFLEEENLSAHELYKKLGYSGNASKTFRVGIGELISEGKVRYATSNKQDANNVLIKKHED
jgi:ATP-dependent DNA helicase RecG